MPAEEKRDSFEIEPTGEIVEYISLAQARLVAIRHVRENLSQYGQGLREVDIVWEEQEVTDEEDQYRVLLTFRSTRGDVSDTGLEEVFVNKVGKILLRQVLRWPRSQLAPPAPQSAFGRPLAGRGSEDEAGSAPSVVTSGEDRLLARRRLAEEPMQAAPTQPVASVASPQALPTKPAEAPLKAEVKPETPAEAKKPEPAKVPAIEDKAALAGQLEIGQFKKNDPKAYTYLTNKVPIVEKLLQGQEEADLAAARRLDKEVVEYAVKAGSERLDKLKIVAAEKQKALETKGTDLRAMEQEMPLSRTQRLVRIVPIAVFIPLAFAVVALVPGCVAAFILGATAAGVSSEQAGNVTASTVLVVSSLVGLVLGVLSVVRLVYARTQGGLVKGQREYETTKAEIGLLQTQVNALSAIIRQLQTSGT